MTPNARLDELDDLLAKLGRWRVSPAQDYEGLDDLSPESDGRAYHRGLGDGGVVEDRALDLEGSDAVACALDHVVGAPLEPEVALRISSPEIADGHPATAAAHGGGALGIAPVPERIVALRMRLQGDLAHRVDGRLAAIVVDDRHGVAGQGQTHRAGPHFHLEAVAIADGQAELARAVVIHDSDAPVPLEERHDLAIQRLAAAAGHAEPHRPAPQP